MSLYHWAARTVNGKNDYNGTGRRLEKDKIESKLRLEIPAVLNYIEKKNKFHTLQKG